MTTPNEKLPIPLAISDTNKKLTPCPCGKTPTKLLIHGEDAKWKWATGDCCNEWHVEFRTGYKEAHTFDCALRAIDAWNNATRPTPSIKWPEPYYVKEQVVYRNDRERDMYFMGYNKAIDACKALNCHSNSMPLPSRQWVHEHMAPNGVLGDNQPKRLDEVYDAFMQALNGQATKAEPCRHLVTNKTKVSGYEECANCHETISVGCDREQPSEKKESEVRQLAGKVAQCLYGKNNKWEEVDTIVDIIDILIEEGWPKKASGNG
jgi:hypothetical protein